MDSSNAKLVSVIVPTYKRADVICRALDSIIAQTYPDIEIIIVDDNSPDNTESVVKEYINQNSSNRKIHYIRNSDNLGNAGNRNVGIRAAKGDLVAFLDDDDEWLPSKIAKQVQEIEEEDADACFCGTIWLESGEVLKKDISLNSEVSFEFGGPTSVWLIKRDVFDRIGMFDENFRANVDGELVVRLNKNCEVTYVNKFLYKHYYYDNQITASNKNKIHGYESMIRKHKSIFNSKELSSAYAKLVVFYLFDNQKKFNYIFNSLRNKISLSNLLLFFIMIVPTVSLSKFLLNKVLDYKRYPKSFAGRYK